MTLSNWRQASPWSKKMISNGWPRIVADIKTLLETGETLAKAPAEGS